MYKIGFSGGKTESTVSDFKNTNNNNNNNHNNNNNNNSSSNFSALQSTLLKCGKLSVNKTKEKNVLNNQIQNTFEYHKKNTILNHAKWLNNNINLDNSDNDDDINNIFFDSSKNSNSYKMISNNNDNYNNNNIYNHNNNNNNKNINNNFSNTTTSTNLFRTNREKKEIKTIYSRSKIHTLNSHDPLQYKNDLLVNRLGITFY
jgi:hypothetical protein